MANVTVIQPTIIEEKMNKIRIAAYCRVSSDSADQLNSFMAQMSYYSEKFNCSENDELVDIYADEGLTGTKIDKREEFKRMLCDCRKGKIDKIITKSISRFSRNTKDCLVTLRELKELGISVFFEKEQIDTGMMTSEMMVAMMGSMAQEESISISNNVGWGIKKRMEDGSFIASSVPYGYILENGILKIHDEQAKDVKKIFKLFLSGLGAYAIAQQLNAEGRRKEGLIWNKNTIRYILSNEKYIGDCLFQKWYTPNVLPFRCVENKGIADKYYVQNHHEQIISHDDFNNVQKVLNQRGQSRIGKENREYSFSNKIYCGNCNTLFKRKKRKNETYWVCRNHDDKAENCPSKQVSESILKSVFINFYNKLKSNYKIILIPVLNQLGELKLKKFNGNTKILEINKEIAELKEQSHVLSRLQRKGFIDSALFIEQSTEINGKIDKLSKELRQITRLEQEDEVIDSVKMLINLMEKDNDLMQEFNENIFESIVEKMILKSESELEFQLLGGLKFTERIGVQ